MPRFNQPEIPRTVLERLSRATEIILAGDIFEVAREEPELLRAFLELHDAMASEDREVIRASFDRCWDLFVEPPGSADHATTGPLWLVTGMAGDAPRRIEERDRCWGQALYVRDRQDRWSPYEHREYWEAHLSAWQPARGRPPLASDALVDVLVKAINYNVDPAQVLLRLGYQRNDGRWPRWLEAAEDRARIRATIPHHSLPLLLPRVVDSDELEEALSARCSQNTRPEHARGGTNQAAALANRAALIVSQMFGERAERRAGITAVREGPDDRPS